MMRDMFKIIFFDEGYEMIVKGNYVYMIDELEVRFKVMKDCKNLEMVDEMFYKVEFLFVIRKNVEFKEVFNK